MNASAYARSDHFAGTLRSPAEVRLSTLSQLAPAGSWQLELAHDREDHLLIWVTRGQGIVLLDGVRRGVGTHNALFVPARHLMALDLGRQGLAQVLLIPDGADLTLPDGVRHLRCREARAQSELTTLFEAMNREQSSDRPLKQSALDAYGQLAAIWLRRQLADHEPEPDTPSRRLMRAYFSRIATQYATGATLADHAAALGVTPTHLTRVCKAETGHTAAGLLTERVLHAARQLLRDSDQPVRNIAGALGFGSAAYFTRFIQHHCGHPPTALRGPGHD